MIQPRKLAASALMEVVARYAGQSATPPVLFHIKRDTLALMKAQGVDLTEHANKIKVSFIRPDLPNLDIPDELLAGIPIH
jgi:hypothetical protein